ncbi:MAG: hypothetical protein IKS47_04705 [Bacteroidales bacterium]|nr:hypothetical protein [Bacteroidales bacterium]
MKRLLLAAAMLTAFVFTMSAQNNYSRLWAKVRQAEKEGKPQTAAGLLRELEEKTIKAGDELEQLAVSEELYNNLRKYNWKEANAYYSTYAKLNRRVLTDSLDAYIVKYADHPRVMMLLNQRLRNHKEALDRRWRPAATGEEYLAVRKEAQELLRHKNVGSYKESIQSLIDGMDSQSLSAGHHATMAPGEGGYVIGSRNVQEVSVKLYRLLDDRQFLGGYKNSTEETLRRNGTLVSTQTVGPMKNEYNIHEENNVTLDFPVPGVYVVRFAAVPAKSGDNSVCYDEVFVSNVVGALRTRGGRAEVYAADFRTGKPFNEGDVSLYKNLFRNPGSAIVNMKKQSSDSFRGEGFQPVNVGKALSDMENDYQLRVEANRDIYASLLSVMAEERVRFTRSDHSFEQAVLFTDRALYKPTDTIHFKLICYNASQTKGNVVADKPVKVTLRHVSEDKPVDTLELVTNAMGSAAGAFTLPEGAKNGNYYIEAEYLTSRRVRVEEYKRPNFMVTLEPVTEALCFGDVVKQGGTLRSYAGYSVAGGEVRYRIHRTTRNTTTGRYYGRYLLTEGTVLSDNDGRFEVLFPAERPQHEEIADSDLLNATYDIHVQATDPQGETHEATITVPVADIPVDLNVELPDNTHFEDRLIVDKDNVKAITVTGSTLNGTPYSCPVTWSVLSADEKSVAEGEGLSNEPVAFDFGTLPSGDYKVMARTEIRGREIKAERKVVVMSTDDRKLPFKSSYFYYPIQTEGAIEFVLGTTEDDLYLELEIFDNDEQLYREGVHLQNEMRKFKIAYKPEWRSAVKVSVFGIRNGEEIDNTYSFTRPGDVRLDVGIETFRDKTTPGSTETMTLRAPAGSELLVSIYDATTDRYGANSFSFHPLQEYVSVTRPMIQTTVSPFRYYALDRMMMKGAAPGMVEEAMVMQEMADSSNAAEVEEDSGEDTPEFQGRSNFSELVAFYPQVPADPSGKTEITYTVTDLLTTFKVLVLAHDSRVYAGDAAAEFIVQQELMVQPNVPLFVTEGDRLVLKSKLVNLSSKELKGTAYIELTDANGKKLRMKGLESQKRTLLAGAQDEVSWTITAPGGTDKLTCKIWFVTPTSTDGEQHEIQVVPNTITLTEAASFVMGGKHGHKYYEKLLRKQFGASDPKIEYAEYSTLDAVMESLPKAETPASNNAIEWTNQLYINQMRNFVLKDDPADYKSFRDQAFSRLKVLQSGDGGVQWFPGMRSNTLLTLFILEKLGQLRQVGALEPADDEMAMVEKMLSYIDVILDDVDNQKKFNPFGLVRLFAVRSMWFDVPMRSGTRAVYAKFIDGTADGWQDISILEKAQLCNTMLRAAGTQYDDKRFKDRIKLLRESLKDYAVENATVGCYFPNAVMPYRGLMNSEIYAHAQLIETFGALGEKKMVDGIAQWLLLQKHNQAWENTVATTDAVHALVSSKAKDLKLGAVYYTYTTKLEKVKASANEITVRRTFVRASTGAPLIEGETLHVGDEIIVTYDIHNTENRSFVEMRAMRPASFYPRDERSYYSWYGWYREVKPSETHYYWELLPEENISLQERFYVQQEGTFNSGLVEIECLYAKEYRGHTDAVTLTTK